MRIQIFVCTAILLSGKGGDRINFIFSASRLSLIAHLPIGPDAI